MTWIDVADSAIKIGLGALIGVVGTVIVTLIKSHQDKSSDLSTRRREMLQKAAADFEEQHSVFNELYALYSTFLELQNIRPDAASISRQKTKETVIQRVGPAIKNLQRLKGTVSLAANDKATICLESYLQATAELNRACLIPEAMGVTVKLPTPQEFQSLANRLADTHSELLFQLRQSFERA